MDSIINQGPVVKVNIKTPEQIIDEYYPTFKHKELGKLYDRQIILEMMEEYKKCLNKLS